MTEPTETPERAPIAPLMESLSSQLVALVKHAGAHGFSDGASGSEPAEAPECLVDHINDLLHAVFALTAHEHHGATIVLPSELPEGLIEQLQEIAQRAARIGRAE